MNEQVEVDPHRLTIDDTRAWIDVVCAACGTPAKITNGPGNVVSRPTTVTATLSDGTSLQVLAQEEVPALDLLWECGARLTQPDGTGAVCGHKQRESL